MNVENAQKLLDHLIRVRDATAKNAPGFHMMAWFKALYRTKPAAINGLRRSALGMAEAITVNEGVWCGTNACLAGHAQWLLADTDYEREIPAERFAQDALGLNSPEAYRWFYGCWTEDDPQNAARDTSWLREGRLKAATIDKAIDFITKEIAAAQPGHLPPAGAQP